MSHFLSFVVWRACPQSVLTLQNCFKEGFKRWITWVSEAFYTSYSVVRNLVNIRCLSPCTKQSVCRCNKSLFFCHFSWKQTQVPFFSFFLRQWDILKLHLAAPGRPPRWFLEFHPACERRFRVVGSLHRHVFRVAQLQLVSDRNSAKPKKLGCPRTIWLSVRTIWYLFWLVATVSKYQKPETPNLSLVFVSYLYHFDNPHNQKCWFHSAQVHCCFSHLLLSPTLSRGVTIEPLRLWNCLDFGRVTVSHAPST